MICPRCKGTNLYREGDEDYVGCYFCGPVFVGVALDIPAVIRGEPFHSSGSPRKARPILEVRHCSDCGHAITHKSKTGRCMPCSARVNSGKRKTVPHGQTIVLRPREVSL